jgi:hypothetical protein
METDAMGTENQETVTAEWLLAHGFVQYSHSTHRTLE